MHRRGVWVTPDGGMPRHGDLLHRRVYRHYERSEQLWLLRACVCDWPRLLQRSVRAGVRRRAHQVRLELRESVVRPRELRQVRSGVPARRQLRGWRLLLLAWGHVMR